MGLYANYVFPWLMELTLGRQQLAEDRRKALADARGEVLEIGFGTGLNLPHYPREVDLLAAVDPARMLYRRVERRIAAAPMPVEIANVDAAGLPFDAGRFDCVVTTWTLCSIDNVTAALGEIRRVLKPGGAYLFLEHGRSGLGSVARWQDRINPLWRHIGVGCNLNRPIDSLIRGAGFHVERLERYAMADMPRILAEHYVGRATI